MEALDLVEPNFSKSSFLKLKLEAFFFDWIANLAESWCMVIESNGK